jgi:archaemetzincin
MKRALFLLLLLGCAKPALPPSVPVQESDAGFEKMGTPQPGEWLHRFKEPGQTFERYLDECRNRRSNQRTTIYLQPLGALDERYTRALAQMRAYAEVFFGVTCVLREPTAMPENAFRKERKQYNADQVIGWLEETLPDDALALAGITDQDLYSGELNYVFGLGTLAGRRGVYSLCRFGNDPELFLRRSIKLLSHEVGHIFGMEHCIWYKCVMCGANSLAEDDRYPVHLCPIDLRKLEWNTGFDRAARYRTLEAFYAANGLKEEADWVSARRAGK